MRKLNTVSYTTVYNTKSNFTVALSERPFSNNFTLKSINKVCEDAVSAYVLCSKDSQEPGRIYFVVYTHEGELASCHTVN